MSGEAPGWSRPPMAVLLLVVGFLSGSAAVLVHARWWGILLVLAVLASVWVALPRGWWSRLPLGVGWATAVGLGAFPRAEGDYLVAATLAGYGLLGVSAVLLVAGILGSLS